MLACSYLKKKSKYFQIIGAILSALIAFLCMFWLYSAEFSIDISTTSSLEAAIDEYNFTVDMDVNVIETEKVKNHLFALYEREDLFGNYGIAELERGIFGKYRFRNCSNSNWQLYNFRSETIDKRNYLLIYGVNDLSDVVSFTVFSSDKMETVLYTGNVEHSPFLRIVEIEERYSVLPAFIRYYNEDGVELAERDLLSQFPNVYSDKAGMVGSAELWLVYVLLAIVFILGIIFIRYFISPLPWKKK